MIKTSRFISWLIAIRPQTLMASAMPVIVATTMAYGNPNFSWLTFITTLTTAILIQISTNLSNDYFDFIKGADTEERVGFKRVTQSRLISLQSIKTAFSLTLFLAALLGIYLVYLGGLPILIIGILSLILALAYTAGPYPLAYNGLGDIFVFLFFGPIAVCGTYYLLTMNFDYYPLLAGCSLGSIINGILVVNNLRDLDGDRKANKKTVIVKFGYKFGQYFYLILMLPCTILPTIYLAFYSRHLGLLLTLLYLIPATILVKAVFQQNEAQKLNKTLVLTGQSVCFFSLLFCLGWMVNF